jgi:hypothetical protein
VALTGRFRDLVRLRAAALDRYAAWEAAHPTRLVPAEAVEALGALLDMMPRDVRERPVDTTGIARLHAALTRLAR